MFEDFAAEEENDPIALKTSGSSCATLRRERALLSWNSRIASRVASFLEQQLAEPQRMWIANPIHRGSIPDSRNGAIKFYSCRTQSFSLRSYIGRLSQSLNASSSSFVLALVYLRRLAERSVDFKLCHLNAHRLVLTAFLLAIKFIEDITFPNDVVAFVGGLPVLELNSLELVMLRNLGFSAFVSQAEFQIASAKYS